MVDNNADRVQSGNTPTASATNSWSMTSDCEPGLVSVIIPTYNRASLLTEALHSVAEQSYSHLEVVLIDDGSTDNTATIVEDFRADRDDLSVRYCAQPNAGVSAARNKGLLLSRGEFIQYLDSDDILHPSKFACQVQHLIENPTLDFVYSASAAFKSGVADAERPCTGFQVSAPLLTCISRHPLPWHTSSGVYRRRTCVAVGPWDEALYCWEDWNYHSRVCMATRRIGYVPGVISFIRRSGQERITGTEFTPKWLQAASCATSKLHDLLAAEGLLHSPDVRDAFARACFHIARRAASVGQTDLFHSLLKEAQKYAERCSTRLVIHALRLSTAVIGCKASGLALEHSFGISCPIRRAWKQWRS